MSEQGIPGSQLRVEAQALPPDLESIHFLAVAFLSAQTYLFTSTLLFLMSRASGFFVLDLTACSAPLSRTQLSGQKALGGWIRDGEHHP